MPGEGEPEQTQSKPISETITDYAVSAKESLIEAGAFISEKLSSAKETLMTGIEGAKDKLDELEVETRAQERKEMKEIESEG